MSVTSVLISVIQQKVETGNTFQQVNLYRLILMLIQSHKNNDTATTALYLTKFMWWRKYTITEKAFIKFISISCVSEQYQSKNLNNLYPALIHWGNKKVGNNYKTVMAWISLSVLCSPLAGQTIIHVVKSPISTHLINGLIVEGHKLLRPTALCTLYHTINLITCFNNLVLNGFSLLLCLFLCLTHISNRYILLQLNTAFQLGFFFVFFCWVGPLAVCHMSTLQLLACSQQSPAR